MVVAVFATTPGMFYSLLWQGIENSKTSPWGFSGGPVVKNPFANAGDIGSIPGLGRFHMPWGN